MSQSPPFIREGEWYFRRAVGFTIKVNADDLSRVQAIALNGTPMTLTRDELRQWMWMNTFRPWPADRALLERLEAHDLVYWSAVPGGRPTTGAPLLAGPRTRVALRDGVGITVALRDKEEIASWPFMGRRGDMDDKRFHGLRFSSAERGQEVYSVDLYAGPAIRHLLPALHLDDPLAAVLDDCGLLEVAPAAVAYPQSHVTWLGHAAALVKVGAATVLVDPLFIRRSDPPKPYFQPAFDWRALPAIDAILITHADNDHLNAGSLARLPASVPVIIPALAHKKPYQVDIEAALRLLDFRNVVTLDTWASHTLGDVRVTAAPFEGEDWGLELQKATYVVEGPHGRVYLSADSLNAPYIFDEIHQRFGAMDFAFLGISGCEEPLVAPSGFGYGEFYSLWLPHARRNEWQHFTMGPAQAAEAARRLHCKRVFGYAAGGGTFMDMAHADEGTHALLAAELGPTAFELAVGVPVALPVHT